MAGKNQLKFNKDLEYMIAIYFRKNFCKYSFKIILIVLIKKNSIDKNIRDKIYLSKWLN